MNVENLLEDSTEKHRIESFYNALKSVGDMDSKSLHDASWFDDLYANEQSSLYEMHVDESWLDDLDEAA
jgi:hypothetical protein